MMDFELWKTGKMEEWKEIDWKDGRMNLKKC